MRHKDSPCRRRRRPREADAAISLGAEEAGTAVEATPTCAPTNQEPISRTEPRKKAPPTRRATVGNGTLTLKGEGEEEEEVDGDGPGAHATAAAAAAACIAGGREAL